jgi:hypothetical protein
MTTSNVDWAALAQRLQHEMGALVHGDEEKRYGDDFYAEALRRTFRAQRLDRLAYETVDASTGLMTVAEADHLRDSHTIIDRLNAERAREEVKAVREEIRRVYAEARRDIAQGLREWCNERTVPARLRREGVLLAVDRIDPQMAREG